MNRPITLITLMLFQLVPSALPQKVPHEGFYSDSKNWFTKGNFLLARSFVAQETKIKSWEILATKESIVSLFVPNTRALAQLTDLIQDLQ